MTLTVRRAFTLEDLGDGVHSMSFHDPVEDVVRKVPLQERSGFGFVVQLPRIDPGDRLVLVSEAKLPFPILVDGTARYGFRVAYTFDDTHSGTEARPGVYFAGIDAAFRKEGTWKVRLHGKNRPLITRKFIVGEAGTDPLDDLPPGGRPMRRSTVVHQ